MNGITIWRVGGTNECTLLHSTASDPVPCGTGSPFIVTPGIGFGTNATSFLSTLSGTATPKLNGTLVECFGPALSREEDNMVGNSTLQILGQYILESNHSYNSGIATHRLTCACACVEILWKLQSKLVISLCDHFSCGR